jgi:hypothetical protein
VVPEDETAASSEPRRPGACLRVAGARGFIAAVEVTGHEPEENNDVRYPWKLSYRLLATKAADDNVASPAQAGINPNRVIRGPHSTIDPDEYERGVAVMLEAAQRSAA